MSNSTQTPNQVPNQNSSKTSNQTPTPSPEPFVYTEIVKEHFLNPRNFLMGDEKNFPFNAKGTVGNPVCGDQMNMYLIIDEKTEKILDIRWKTYGCASAIASTSALSELAKGKTLSEAEKISAKDIANFLGGLPEHKFHCSILGHEALRDAITNWRKNH